MEDQKSPLTSPTAEYKPVPRRHMRTRCLHCGRKLRDLESLNRGIGPECWEKVQMRNRKAQAKLNFDEVDR